MTLLVRLRTCGVLTAALCACGAAPTSSPEVIAPDVDAGAPSPPDDLPADALRSAECSTRIARHEVPYRAHVPRDWPVEYDTNPPSGGVHYATWVEYGAHRTPVDRREYVHNLEHGAVALLYRCTSADGCPSVAAALEDVLRRAEPDVVCQGRPDATPSRLLVSPDPLLETPIAAAAWGVTLTSRCLDEEALLAFVDEHLGHGPEENCQDGAGGTPMPAPLSP
jgi:hypothetical protein